MNRITKIDPAIAPQAHAAIAKRCLESTNGIAIFKGLCYEVTIGGEVWHIGNGTQTFENTWNDASFGFESVALAADTTAPQHTPGPWSVCSNQLVRGPIGDRIADCNASTGKPDAEKLANARLISAAPELLKIAIAYRNMLQASATTDSDVATFQHIESTIARATA